MFIEGTGNIVDFFVIGKEFISSVMLQRYVRRNPPGDPVFRSSHDVPSLFMLLPNAILNAQMQTWFPEVHL
jgi:hypothetical protein